MRIALRAMAENGEGPFDLVFIDADKPSNPAYLQAALELSRPGTVIIGDNVVREGAVAEPDSDDPRAQGARRFHELLAADQRRARHGSSWPISHDPARYRHPHGG